VIFADDRLITSQRTRIKTQKNVRFRIKSNRGREFFRPSASKDADKRKVVVVLALFELDVKALDRKFTEVRDYL
jgi:hypothetical protein